MGLGVLEVNRPHIELYRADTEGEMRRLATYCEIDVPEERWPAIVAAVQLDAMRADAKRRSGGDAAAMIFDGP